LQAIFADEAEKFGVFPVGDRLAGRLDVSLRPSWTAGQSTCHEGMPHLLEGTVSNVKYRPHLVTADVEAPENLAEGVLLAMGGLTGAYVLCVKDNKLAYHDDLFGFDGYNVESTELLTGKVQLGMDFEYDGGGPGKGGTVTLSVNGKRAGEGRLQDALQVHRHDPQRNG
jgi:arylsulfatase